MGVQWTPDLAVGVKLIDEQHQELFKRVDSLLGAMREGKGKSVLDPVVQFLGQYTVDHFSMEERLMAQHKYPDAGAHKAAHEAFIKDFGELRSQLQAQGASSTTVIQTQRRLVDWLRDHIGKVDKKLGAFLQAK